jgi:hypothetical protein
MRQSDEAMAASQMAKAPGGSRFFLGEGTGGEGPVPKRAKVTILVSKVKTGWGLLEVHIMWSCQAHTKDENELEGRREHGVAALQLHV